MPAADMHPNGSLEGAAERPPLRFLVPSEFDRLSVPTQIQRERAGSDFRKASPDCQPAHELCGFNDLPLRVRFGTVPL